MKDSLHIVHSYALCGLFTFQLLHSAQGHGCQESECCSHRLRALSSELWSDTLQAAADLSTPGSLHAGQGKVAGLVVLPQLRLLFGALHSGTSWPGPSPDCDTPGLANPERWVLLALSSGISATRVSARSHMSHLCPWNKAQVLSCLFWEVHAE